MELKGLCLLLGHQSRRWQLDNPSYDSSKLRCVGGMTSDDGKHQRTHRPSCGCEQLDFYICKRCKKDLTWWTEYRPDPQEEFMK